MKVAQANAARVVALVLNGRTLDTALARVPPSAEAIDRALTQELAYGALRHLGRLRGILRPLLSKPLADLELEALLLVALYQLLHGHAGAHAVVANAVDAAVRLRLTSAKGLVNAVLRHYLRDRDAIDARPPAGDEARFSYPPWWIDRAREDWPQQWAGILDAGNERPPLTLRINRRRATREAIVEAFAAAQIACHAVGDEGLIVDEPRNVHDLPGFDDGLFSVQDHGAQLAAGYLDVRNGMRVLDACAAPGGKTTHIAEQCDCELIALERDDKRLARVRENLARLGLAAAVTTTHADATVVDAWWDGRPFDRILADVPCTASGVVRRHPDSKWLRRPSDIDAFVGQQRRILDALWRVLVPGGRLLYVTCSIFRAENDGQVEAFLAHHANAVRIELPAREHVTMHGSGQLLPVASGSGENHDGFFHALIEKRAGDRIP